jgi:hypothetical protein
MVTNVLSADESKGGMDIAESAWPHRNVAKPHLGNVSRQLAWKELNKAGAAEELFRIKADRSRRLVDFQAVEVIEANLPHEDLLPPFAGTVMLFSEKKGRGVLARLKEAYLTGDRDALRVLGAEITYEVEQRQVVSVKAAAQMLIDSPLSYDLRYGGKTLVGEIAMINDISLGSITLPWSGGELDASQFKIVNYRKSETLPEEEEEGVEHLIVKRRPALNDLERQMLGAIPLEQSELHIGEIVACPWLCATAVVVIYALVTAAGQNNCGYNAKRLKDIQSLSNDALEKLGPHATVRELLVARRKVFEDFRG